MKRQGRLGLGGRKWDGGHGGRPPAPGGRGMGLVETDSERLGGMESEKKRGHGFSLRICLRLGDVRV